MSPSKRKVGLTFAGQGWLIGWKSIGARFGVGWQTAKAWHKRYHMPVLRTPNGAPLQQPEVLDEWMIQFNIQMEKLHPDGSVKWRRRIKNGDN
jgi:hypothetical protein